MTNKIRKQQLDEHGFASIAIALVLIIVLALLTVGFAQLARREQKDALGKQLATQAYYAAESGVNDTVKNLPTLESSPTPPSPTSCGSPVTLGPTENGVQYTCVLVNLKPPNILYDNVQAEDQRYIVSSAASSVAGAGSITVNWGSTDGNTTYPGDASQGFLPANTWKSTKRYPAALQFSITPLNGALNLTRNNLAQNTFTVYLYPTSSGSGSTTYSAFVPNVDNTNGKVVSANCNVSNSVKYPCKATISGFGGNSGPYLFRVTNHYDPSNISISGTDSATGAALNFDGQVQIDATGKAHEVLKRIQVRVPKKATFDLPKEALEAASACKHFTTDPLSGTQPSGLSEDTTGACALN